MRKLLLLALLLYNIVALATISNSYDYGELDGSKRHSLTDDRRNWRKKALLKQPYDDHSTSDRRRQDYDSLRFLEEQDKFYGGIDKQRELDVTSGYRGSHRYYNIEKSDLQSPLKSSELAHSSAFVEKEPDKMKISAINCERPHERYDTCFSGCASVTCDNPRDRLRPCYPFCEAGCICVQPYVRDDRTHKCVLPEDCTKGLKGIPELGEDV